MPRTLHELTDVLATLNPSVRIFAYSWDSVGLVLDASANHRMLKVPEGFCWSNDGTSIINKSTETKYQVNRFVPEDFT